MKQDLSNTAIILSLGQIGHSDQEKTIVALSNEVATQTHAFLAPLARTQVELALTIDRAWFGTLSGYNTNTHIDEFGTSVPMTEDIFRERVTYQLNIELEKEPFFRAWNAMSAVSKEAADSFKEVLEMQQQHGFKLLVVTDTNKSQFDHLNAELGRHGIDLQNNPNIVIVNSFEERTSDRATLAQKAVKEHDKEGNTILSVNTHYDKDTLNLQNASFAEHPFDTRVPGASLAVTLREALNLPEQEKAVEKTNPAIKGAATKAVIERREAANKGFCIIS